MGLFFCVDQDIKKWELVFSVKFICKFKYEIVLKDEL